MLMFGPFVLLNKLCPSGFSNKPKPKPQNKKYFYSFANSMKIKIFFIFCVNMLFLCGYAGAQKYRSNRYSRLNNDNCLSVSLYRTPLPYSYGGKIGYSHNIAENTYLSGDAVAEKGAPYELGYSFIGADIGISYAPFDLGRSSYLYLKASAGGGQNAIGEMNSKGFSVGGKGGLELNCYVQDGLAVGVFFSQGLYGKNRFGMARTEYGLNVKMSLGW